MTIWYYDTQSGETVYDFFIFYFFTYITNVNSVEKVKGTPKKNVVDYRNLEKCHENCSATAAIPVKVGFIYLNG